MTTRHTAATFIPGVIALGVSTTAYLFMGWPIWVLIVPALLAYPLYLATFRRHLPRPGAFLPLYLATVAWQFLHFAEEFATGFQTRFPLALGGADAPLVAGPVWSDALFVGFNMVANAAFLAGAIGILLGRRVPTYFICFFALGMLWNGLGHPALALAAPDGWYFPGLITGIGHLGLSLLLLHRIWRVGRDAAPETATRAPAGA